MMKIRDILAIMAVALTAVGCNQQDDGLQQDERVPILLKATVEDAAKGPTQTRTATTATTQNTEFLNGQKVKVWINENETGHTASIISGKEYSVDNSTVAGNLEPVGTSTPIFFPVGVNTISMYGVHPSSYTSGSDFIVAADQTSDGDYAASDLCYSPAADHTRTTGPVDANGRQIMTFQHALSKIVVEITTNTGKTLPATVKLLAKRTTKMTWSTGSDFSVQAEATGDASYITMGLNDDGTGTKVSGGAIIPPQTIAAGTSFISFTVTGLGPMIYPLPANTTFTSGKRYTYNIKVNNVGITATTNVTDWGEKVANQQVMGKLWDIKKNPLWYMAETNLNQDGVSFSTVNSTSQGYCWRYNSSTGYFQTSLGITYNTTGYNGWYAMGKSIDGESYHMPTQLEWASIIPAIYSNNIFGSYPTAGTVVTEIPCVFSYNNDTRYGAGNTSNPATPTGTAFKSYWSSYTASSNVRYAIRFLGTDFCSVWKYQFVDKGSTSARLIISSKLINTISTENNDALVSMMSTITDASYNWSNDYSQGAVQRVFYACGYHLNKEGAAPGSYEGNTVRGTYACCTPYTSPYIYFFNFYDNCLWIQNTAERNYQAFPVRLFRDN